MSLHQKKLTSRKTQLFREIILYPGPYSGIHGTVTDAITGLPMGGVTVTLRRYIGEFVDLEIEVLTGSDGSYSFHSLESRR